VNQHCFIPRGKIISFEIQNGQITRYWDHKKKVWSFSIIIIIINEVFLKSLRWAGHPILRPFFRKERGVFLKILRQAGHPISRLLFRKSVEFF
jgi:hypothetical protein